MCGGGGGGCGGGGGVGGVGVVVVVCLFLFVLFVWFFVCLFVGGSPWRVVGGLATLACCLFCLLLC